MVSIGKKVPNRSYRNINKVHPELIPNITEKKNAWRFENTIDIVVFNHQCKKSKKAQF